MTGPLADTFTVSVSGPSVVLVEPTCTRCDHATWIIWDAKPWCREHFHEAQDEAAASAAEGAGTTV